jgi:hypothetical protein
MSEITFIDEKYSYRDPVKGPWNRGIDADFPINPYYDAKAWRWLQTNVSSLPKPTLFWNVGA